jgi:flagellar basal body-associated protein FliL
LIAAIVLVIGAGVFHLNASDEYMFQDMEEYQHTENAEQQDGNLVKSPVLEQLDALRTNFHAHLIHLSPSTTQSKQNRSIEQFL